MPHKLEIALCMGSSCFARGNNQLLEVVRDLIAGRGWEDQVILSGMRCEEHCMQGPNIRVDGVLYPGMDEGALLDLLESKLGVGDATPRSSVRLSSPRKSSERKGL